MFQVDTGRVNRRSRALVVSVTLGRGAVAHAEQDALDEMIELARSAGYEIRGSFCARRDRPDPAHYLGGGKVEELAAQLKAADAGVALFDVALSPAQQRNLERQLDVPVLDRTALILDIFAQRAKSREGKLQVELAQLEHLSTRLVRGWTHLERQRGGLGKTGGPGEKQIELDRRLIASRVKLLRERLKTLHKQRRTQRRARARRDVFSVSLVGYTNAGKSTLFNALTRADAFAADQLFATLDTTSRRCHVADDVDVVVSDTVGFIRGLPHQLVEAFKSTLEESVEADLLLHVVDVSTPARDAQMAEVERVLDEIGAAQVPRLVVYNKIDRIDRAPSVERDPCGSIRAVFVSAMSGQGLDPLREAIAERARQARAASAALSEIDSPASFGAPA
ncbi:MAG: GTPase HflX [Burkholderiaceae bacterium]|nr:GTPase HflX [Burkholderiaceae bacterium]